MNHTEAELITNLENLVKIMAKFMCFYIDEDKVTRFVNGEIGYNLLDSKEDQ